MSVACSPSTNSLFSVPLEHLWRIDFAGAPEVAAVRTTGLSRFIGDDANHLLRYLTTDDFVDQMTRQLTANPDDTPIDYWRIDESVCTPIVFYGPAGTGKTSLAMALISKLLKEIEQQPIPMQPGDRSVPTGKHRPAYFTGSDFARKFYAAIETNTVDEFRSSILSAPALLIDDLQDLEKKLPAQRELESLLDQLSALARPVFVICNQTPDAITGLGSRLISRLYAGLMLPFHPPGVQARRQIARELAAIHQLHLTDDAVDLLIERFEVTVPRLEHLFSQSQLKLRMRSSGDHSNHQNVGIATEPTKGPKTEPMTRERSPAASGIDSSMATVIDARLLTDLLTPGEEELTAMTRAVQKVVARAYGLRQSDLKSNSRKHTVAMARGVAIYLIREMLGISFSRIGGLFGGRDHSTILHAYRKMEAMCQCDEGLRDEGQRDGGEPDASKDITGGKSNEHRETVTRISQLKQQLTDRFATGLTVDSPF